MYLKKKNVFKKGGGIFLRGFLFFFFFFGGWGVCKKKTFFAGCYGGHFMTVDNGTQLVLQFSECTPQRYFFLLF